MSPYTADPHEHEVADDATIWRYMNLEKFMLMAVDSTLFFSTMNGLDDPFEGNFPDKDFERLSILQDELAAVHANKDTLIDPFTVKDIKNRINSVFVNCWSESEEQSALMWRLYGGRLGVVIKSTVNKLRRSLQNNPPIKIYKVHYLESYGLDAIFGKDHHPVVDPLEYALHKRIDFQYEQEIRACIEYGQHAPIKRRHPDGVFVKVDLNTLFDELYVSPTKNKWLEAILEETCEKLKIEKMVKESNLFRLPTEHG